MKTWMYEYIKLSFSFVGADVNRYRCDNCNRHYKYKNHLNSHLNYECGKTPKFKCHGCDRKFFQRFKLNAHIKCSRKCRVPSPVSELIEWKNVWIVSFNKSCILIFRFFKLKLFQERNYTSSQWKCYSFRKVIVNIFYQEKVFLLQIQITNSEEIKLKCVNTWCYRVML